MKPGQYCYDRIKDTLPRDEIDIPSGDVKLRGYIYRAKSPKALLVVAHGFHAGADDYLPLIEFFYNRGFSVLAYNVRGTYESEGESTVGMCQSLVDLDAAIEYAKSDATVSCLPVVLIGHSWGGYAAASVLGRQKHVKACALLAPMNNGYTVMLEKAEQYVGKLGAMPKPVFNFYQRLLFGEYTAYDGVSGINSTDIPIVLAQGVDDKTISYSGQSIMAHRDEITNPNVIYYDGLGVHGDHNNIWHSDRAALYQLEVKSREKLLEIKKGSSLSVDDRRELYKTVDHRLYSEVNYPLFELIADTFEGTL